LLKFGAIYFFVFVLAYFGVEIFRRWSLSREIVDIPNERSSHSVPTPRGGGIVICLVSILTLLFYIFASGTQFFWSYFIGAVIVSLISLVDDIRTISPFLRILFHGFAAALVIGQLGAFEIVSIPFYGTVELGILGTILTFLWIVWLINAYNFMDGIDGIAATQAVTAGIGWSVAGFLSGAEAVGFYGAVLTAASFGFLFHNWQPAKIFMGDVGSAFLGYTFAVLPLFAIRTWQPVGEVANLPWIALVLVWFFIFDSVYTFFKRLMRGEKVWRAHREHIYQKLVISGLSHSFVTSLYGAGSAILAVAAILAAGGRLSLEGGVLPFVFGETILLLFFFLYKVKFGR
jgi:Fuc2NAc and GlcNAc transferase